MRLAPLIILSLLTVGCASSTSEDSASSPLSLQLDDIVCDIGVACDFTGEFERQPSLNSAPDALYTYDYEDRQCVLFVGDLKNLATYEAVKKDITLPRSEFINIKGRGVDRGTIPEWSGSDFCDDREVVVKIESIESAFLTFHEK